MTTEPTPTAAQPATYEVVVDGRPRQVDGPALRPLEAALRDDLTVVTEDIVDKREPRDTV